MKSARHTQGFLIVLPLLLLLCLPVVGQAPSTNGSPHGAPRDPQTDAAFDHFYNMEYDRATQEFEKILEKHPNDPFAVNHLLTEVLMRNLYETGGMNTGDYSNDSFIGHAPRPTDQKVKDRIKGLAHRAEALEEQQLKANPKDVGALYCRGVTRAQFSVYTGIVERAWFSALRNAVGARHDHEHVLELDPDYLDAKMVVGTHNYVVGNLPWTVKVAAALAGLSGSKDKGLEYLREVAKSDGENSVDAKVMLSLFLRREHQYDEALGDMRELAAKYPKNHLFLTEVANLLRSAGRLDEAETVYRTVWQNGREGKYGNLHYEMAAWGLGDLLRSKKELAAAATAYELVNDAPNPDPDILQKANLAAGEMYDLLQKRDLAMKRYQTVLAGNANTGPADQARRYIREAYRE
ncbi:MAG TPA: tetratricopeptide repeat protein [Candidatus Sulfotelmatobacter sp.]|nr:tetratricopeptide repeat protein [Candidatus Sulfotelmatobacter sp.]